MRRYRVGSLIVRAHYRPTPRRCRSPLERRPGPDRPQSFPTSLEGEKYVAPWDRRHSQAVEALLGPRPPARLRRRRSIRARARAADARRRTPAARRPGNARARAAAVPERQPELHPAPERLQRAPLRAQPGLPDAVAHRPAGLPHHRLQGGLEELHAQGARLLLRGKHGR